MILSDALAKMASAFFIPTSGLFFLTFSIVPGWLMLYIFPKKNEQQAILFIYTPFR